MGFQKIFKLLISDNQSSSYKSLKLHNNALLTIKRTLSCRPVLLSLLELILLVHQTLLYQSRI